MKISSDQIILRDGRRRRAAPKVSAGRYERCCRAILAAIDRRGGRTDGLAVDNDREARWWRAWNTAAMRIILQMLLVNSASKSLSAPSPGATSEKGEPVRSERDAEVYPSTRAPISPVRSRPAAAGKRKPRGRRISAGCSATTPGVK